MYSRLTPMGNPLSYAMLGTSCRQKWLPSDGRDPSTPEELAQLKEEYAKSVPLRYKLESTDLDAKIFPMQNLFFDVHDAIAEFRKNMEKELRTGTRQSTFKNDFMTVLEGLWYAQLTDMLYPSRCPITVYHDSKDARDSLPLPEEMLLPSVQLFKKIAVQEFVVNFNNLVLEGNGALDYYRAGNMLIMLLTLHPFATTPEIHVHNIMARMRPLSLPEFVSVLVGRANILGEELMQRFFDPQATLEAALKVVRDNPKGNYVGSPIKTYDPIPHEDVLGNKTERPRIVTTTVSDFFDTFRVMHFRPSPCRDDNLVLYINSAVLMRAFNERITNEFFSIVLTYLENGLKDLEDEVPNKVKIALHGAIDFIVTATKNFPRVAPSKEVVDKLLAAIRHHGVRALWRHAAEKASRVSQGVKAMRLLLEHIRFRPAEYEKSFTEDADGNVVEIRKMTREAGPAARYLVDIHSCEAASQILGLDDIYVPPEIRDLPPDQYLEAISELEDTHRSIRNMLMPLRGSPEDEDVLQLYNHLDHVSLDVEWERARSLLANGDAFESFFVNEFGEWETNAYTNGEPSGPICGTNDCTVRVEDCYIRIDDEDPDVGERATKKPRAGPNAKRG